MYKLLTYVIQGYISTIFWCLKKGKFKGALLKAIVPLAIVTDESINYLKYKSWKFFYRITGREFIVTINNDYKMYLNPHDRGISSDLCISQTREVFTTRYIQKLISEDITIIDIGANIGYYALLESQLASKGHVYAIEPVPENYDFLTKNIGLNNCKNVSSYNFAMGNVPGFLAMYVYDKYNYSSFIKNPDATIINIIQVPIVSLDTFIESHVPDHPHFIRMDVEGFEYEVLKGSSTTLQAAGPLIMCIEMHPHLMSGNDVSGCTRIMKDNRFTVKSIILDVGSPSELKFFHLINELKNILNLPQYGYCGNDFSTLEDLLIRGQNVTVFFEKTAGVPRSACQECIP